MAAQLGAPSPEGLTSPAYFNNQTVTTLLAPSVGAAVGPNRNRIAGGGAFGTLIVGTLIVQLYVRHLGSGLTRPQKELKSFARVSLQPG